MRPATIVAKLWKTDDRGEDSMTQLLERAIAEARKLPDPAQDAIATLILEEIADENAWDESFDRSQDQLGEVAAKVRQDIAAGRVRPLKRRKV